MTATDPMTVTDIHTEGDEPVAEYRRRDRWRPGDTVALYPLLVEETRHRWRTWPELIETCQPHFERPITRATISKLLRDGTDAGAFAARNRAARGGRPGFAGYEYRSTPKAMRADVMADAVGPRNARFLPIDTPHEVPDEMPAHVARLVSADTRPVPAPEAASDERGLPESLFTATFRPDGVLITYDQFHRVLALLNMLGGETDG